MTFWLERRESRFLDLITTSVYCLIEENKKGNFPDKYTLFTAGSKVHSMKELTVYKVMNIMDVQTLSKAAIHDSRILFEMHKIVKPYRLARESAK